MRIVALVLKGEQQLQVSRIDIAFGIDRQPPTTVGHGVSAQQFSIAVDDGGGHAPRVIERQWAEGDDPCAEGDGGDKASGDKRCRQRPHPPPALRGCYCRPIAHFAGRTSTEPVALRP
jgi:hypothetical protein